MFKKTLFSFILAALFPLMIFGGWLYYLNYESTSKNFKSMVSRKIFSDYNVLNRIISDKLTLVRTWADMDLLHVSIELNRAEALDDFISKIKNLNNYFSSILVFDYKNNLFSSTNTPPYQDIEAAKNYLRIGKKLEYVVVTNKTSLIFIRNINNSINGFMGTYTEPSTKNGRPLIFCYQQKETKGQSSYMPLFYKTPLESYWALVSS